MIAKLLSSLQERSAKKKAEIFFPFFQNKNESVLDFGAGDLSLARVLYEKNKKLRITGIDVVDFKSKLKNIYFKKYDGQTIPFKSNSFDSVISVFVFHHCLSAEASFRECLRVGKKRVIIIEAVARTPKEIPLMRFIDWLSNIWKNEDIPLTYQFLTIQQWKRLFKKYNTSLRIAKSQSSIFSILPVGKMYIFEVLKK